MRDNRRVVARNRRGGWDVRAPRSKRISSHHWTREDAIAWAKDIVRNAGGGQVVAEEGRGGETHEIDVDPPRGQRILFSRKTDEALYPADGAL
jgi:hypothetical protein